jgi:hypothetical protein
MTTTRRPPTRMERTASSQPRIASPPPTPCAEGEGAKVLVARVEGGAIVEEIACRGAAQGREQRASMSVRAFNG